jgi:[acyl-carrier-protein] S-malonyltransferase
MKNVYVFPGQGAQFSGMGKDLYENNAKAKELFEKANEILGFRISDIMFAGSEEELKQTNVTQPAVFIHSVITYLTLAQETPNMTAGHSLGEFSALVAAGVLTFEDALKLVAKRADAMQKACQLTPSTMAAILGLEDDKVVAICATVTDEIVVPANYNCPGQLVISGTIAGVNTACDLLKVAGAKRALVLPVGGAFHSPLMQPAQEELKAAIEATDFKNAQCPVYQNVDAQPYTEAVAIKQNLMNQLTAPVRWTQSVQNMITDGATNFIESGPGNVLQGLVKKIDRNASTSAL